MDARAELLGPDQQPRRHVARIDREIARAVQRAAVIGAEAGPQRGAIEKRRLDAGGAAQFGLALQVAYAETSARKVERTARLRLKPALAQIAFQVRHGEAQAPPRADR